MSSPVNSIDRHDGTDAGGLTSAQGIACNGCRKAKLRCSRDRPTCANCARVGHECVYETKRVKPGIKAGAIEIIHRRLDDLENRLVEQKESAVSLPRLDTQQSVVLAGDTGAAHNVLSLLARELPKLLAGSSPDRRHPYDPGSSPAKRRRVEHGSDTERVAAVPDGKPAFPDPDVLKVIIDTYFTHTHPWIPMLNQDRFRQRIDDRSEQLSLETVIHAIHITVSRYMADEDTFSDDWPADRVRRWVVMTSMDDPSIESLQALIVIAYNDIGNGNAARAWSIVASMSRTVEYLQITIDPEEGETRPVNRPFHYLPLAKDWTDQEERRRVFWNVFLLDRFCSITMGWNTSLTSIDVHQRLPCDGILWRKQEAVTTPYLGIWDRSTGGIGNMSPMTSRRHGADGSANEMDRRGSRAGSYSTPRGDDTDVSRIGAFAYCVEATESMSRVTTYFLQQRIDPTDPEDVNAWLARFKELDLRLVHWKMFLPQKWKSNVPKQASRMDPNLTLAHITHNASTILLHQIIAYPPLSWQFRKQLPSVWSAETCCLAGIEISTITRKYLENIPLTLPIASSFAFCVYIAARVMLVHWRHDTQNRHLNEFWSLTHSLEEMSRRWAGPSVSPETQRVDLSAKFAYKLREFHRRCMQDKTYRISITDYTQEIDHRSTFVPPLRRPSEGWNAPVIHPPQSASLEGQWSADAHPEQIDFPNGHEQTPGAQHGGSGVPYQNFDMGAAMPIGHNNPHGIANPNEGPMARVGMPNNEYLMDMKRVIEFNDGSLFSADLESGVW